MDGETKTLTRSEFAAMSHNDRMDFLLADGRVVDDPEPEGESKGTTQHGS